MEEIRASRSMHREIFRLQCTKLQAENLKEDLAWVTAWLEDDTKVDVCDVECEDVDWIQLPLDVV